MTTTVVQLSSADKHFISYQLAGTQLDIPSHELNLVPSYIPVNLQGVRDPADKCWGISTTCESAVYYMLGGLAFQRQELSIDLMNGRRTGIYRGLTLVYFPGFIWE